MTALAVKGLGAGAYFINNKKPGLLYCTLLYNSPGFDPSILRNIGVLGAADEAVLNKVHKKSPYCTLHSFFLIRNTIGLNQLGMRSS